MPHSLRCRIRALAVESLYRTSGLSLTSTTLWICQLPGYSDYVAAVPFTWSIAARKRSLNSADPLKISASRSFHLHAIRQGPLLQSVLFSCYCSLLLLLDLLIEPVRPQFDAFTSKHVNSSPRRQRKATRLRLRLWPRLSTISSLLPPTTTSALASRYIYTSWKEGRKE